uniref:Uncharacterized protein n=1 Tax=Cacopsylla melanoneura TaxID=428564 RepID=A0A8D9C0W2_9HEMI
MVTTGQGNGGGITDWTRRSSRVPLNNMPWCWEERHVFGGRGWMRATYCHGRGPAQLLLLRDFGAHESPMVSLISLTLNLVLSNTCVSCGSGAFPPNLSMDPPTVASISSRLLNLSMDPPPFFFFLEFFELFGFGDL